MSGNDPHKTDAKNATKSTQVDAVDGKHGVGDIPSTPAAESPGDGEPLSREAEAAALTKRVSLRFQRERRWFGDDELAKQPDEMMKLARKRLDKTGARLFVYAELDRLFPPLVENLNSVGRTVSASHKSSSEREAEAKRATAGQIQGPADIPQVWPDLPANASMAVEIGWVQANRLRIVEEQANGATVIRLGQALSPAPSRAALGWLETSIRCYAKYVDVAAKATASDDGEAGVMKLERMAIDEVEALLGEMEDAGKKELERRSAE